MLERVTDVWEPLPIWAKWGIGISAAVLVQAMLDARGEHNFLIGTAQNWVAWILFYGSFLGPLALAIWVGMALFSRTQSHWVSWPVGIALFAAVQLPTGMVVQSLPGVGWRISAMADSDCYTDWDGRSNPTVCE